MNQSDYKIRLSLKKMDFIQQVVSETSLDTLCSWLDMYEEARYVASLYSDEEELIEFRTNYENLLKLGLGQK